MLSTAPSLSTKSAVRPGIVRTRDCWSFRSPAADRLRLSGIADVHNRDLRRQFRIAEARAGCHCAGRGDWRCKGSPLHHASIATARTSAAGVRNDIVANDVEVLDLRQFALFA
jgi:hypothetical protein